MKKKELIPEAPETAGMDERTQAAADAEAIMRKYDRESNTRVWEGVPKYIVGTILAVFSLYCIYVTIFANFLEQIRLSSFLGLVVIMGYLTYPAKKGHVRDNHIPWYDIVLMVVGAAAYFYFTVRAPALMTMRV